MEFPSMQNLEQGLVDGLKPKPDDADEREAQVSKNFVFAEQPSTSQATFKANLKVEAIPRRSDINVTSGVVDEGQPHQSSEHNKDVDIVKKHGSKDTEVNFLTRYFCSLTKPKYKIYQYLVTMKPKVEMLSKRISILYQLKSLLGNFIYDGMTLFTATKQEYKGMSYATASYTITLIETGIIKMNHKQFLQVLNLIIRRSMKVMNLKRIHHHYFDPKAKVDLREFILQMWPVNRIKMRRCTNENLHYVQVKHKIYRKETVYDILQNCKRNSKDYREDFRRIIVGTIIYTNYNNCTFQIDDVDFEKTPKDTFKHKSTTVSFLNYFYNVYNLRIHDWNQPILISIKRRLSDNEEDAKIISLIPEFCIPTGLSDSMISNESIMRAISGYTRINHSGLMKFNKPLKDCENNVRVLNNWYISLDNKLLQIKGRITEPRGIILQDRNKISTHGIADWSNVFKNYGMYWNLSVGLHRWAVIACAEHAEVLRNFVDALQTVGRNMKMPIALPREILIANTRNASYIRAMEECFCHDPQFVMCVVTNSSLERYAYIKTKCYVGRAVPNHVVLLRDISSRRTLFGDATKVVLQINSKLGFAPWMFDIPLSGLMTIGYYTAYAHIYPYKKFAALVATMDLKENPTFFSTAKENTTKSKHADLVWHMMAKALEQYVTEHRKLPYRILFYHYVTTDAKSDDLLYKHDINIIVERLESEYKRYKSEKPPKFAYVTAGFNVNARFFNGADNPPPGIVIDDGFRTPDQFDFYLVSQTVRNISLSPTAYNVLHSTLEISAHELQRLTFKMCYVYNNCMGTSKIPAVCLYARKLVFLINNSLNKTNAFRWQKKFHYI